MMDEKEAGKKQFYLKWPWDWAVYILLVLVLRIFSIPFIYLLIRWNRKRQPLVPEEGYCVQQARRRISQLWSTLVLLLVGVLAALSFAVGLVERQGMEAIVSGLISAVCLACAGFTGYTSLRDAFFPEKSALAQSIRSQMPNPEEAPEPRELFALVDQDIQENGQWFDCVAVGKEWVLGDQASYIPRSRGVFWRDEVVHRRMGGRIHTGRVLELRILDDRHQVQLTTLRDHRAMQPLVEEIRMQAPDAVYLPYDQFVNYNTLKGDAWENFLQEFRCRESKRKAARS